MLFDLNHKKEDLVLSWEKFEISTKWFLNRIKELQAGGL